LEGGSTAPSEGSRLADKKVSYCGILKRRPGEKPFTQKLLEERARDKAREERKLASVRGK
jgi:hypothetical protein